MKRNEQQQTESSKERVLARVLSEELKVTAGGGVRVSGAPIGNLNGSDITDDGPNDQEYQM